MATDIPPTFDTRLFNGDLNKLNPQVVREYWKSRLSDSDKDALVEMGLKYWRERGFPYIDKDHNKIHKSLNKLANFDVSDPRSMLHEGDEISQVNLGVDICNFYQPKMFHVRCNTSKYSVIEAFQNDEMLRKAIRKAFQTTGYCNAAALRSMLRTGGAQMPSNFNPAVAKWIWSTFCPIDGYILDPSAGWGGRALAAICTPHRHYLGIDPHVAAVEGNRKMIRDILSFDFAAGRRVQSSSADFKIACSEAPDGIPSLPDNHFDCIFTSPPYFDVEKYDDDPNQSYIKHGKDGYDSWRKGFLAPLLKECARVLKPEGWCLINVSGSIRKKHNFAKDTLNYGKKFMKYMHTYKIRFALRTQLRKEGGKIHRLEPLFLFQKRGTKTRKFPTFKQNINKECFELLQ